MVFQEMAYPILTELTYPWPMRFLPPYTDAELDYRRSMPMCQRIRPQWDFDPLLRAECRVNPLFMLIATP